MLGSISSQRIRLPTFVNHAMVCNNDADLVLYSSVISRQRVCLQRRAISLASGGLGIMLVPYIHELC